MKLDRNEIERETEWNKFRVTVFLSFIALMVIGALLGAFKY